MEQHTLQDLKGQTMNDEQSVLWEADDEWHSCIANFGTPSVAAFPITLGSYWQGSALFLLFVIWVVDTLDFLVIWHMLEQGTPS